MNLEQALQTFIVESRELLQDMESCLLRLESAPDDSDTLNAIFRAAHTIKGSAGMFGLDLVVSFTHIVESVLDKLRDGDIVVNGEVVALLLKCGDYIGELVTVVAVNGETPSADMLRTENELTQCLHALLSQVSRATSGPVAQLPVQHEAQVEVDAGKSGSLAITDNWHLSLRFGLNVLRNGMDPLSFIRYLTNLGEIVNITMLADAMPGSEQMDPEACYLGFEIDFYSAADKAAIASVFDFVREGSVIHILPPHSKISEYTEMLRQLPEGDQRLGDLLVASGALTPAELEEALRLQQSPPAKPLGEILV